MKYENIVRCQFSSKKNTPMHFHQDIEILYVLEGSLVVEFETANVHLDTDDFLLINSNMRHAIKGESDVLIGSVMIDYTMLTEIFSGEQLFFLCNSAEEDMGSYAKMRNYIRQIFNYYQASEGQGNYTEKQYLLSAFISDHFGIYCKEGYEEIRRTSRNPGRANE